MICCQSGQISPKLSRNSTELYICPSFLPYSIKLDFKTFPRTSGFCFRRTNGTHEIGCSSDLNGNVGVVHVVGDGADLDWVVEKGPHAPYMAVFFPEMFREAMQLDLNE